MTLIFKQGGLAIDANRYRSAESSPPLARIIKAPKGTEMTDSIRNSCRGSLF